MTIPVIVNGAAGKMGHIAVSAINSASDFVLVAKTDHLDNLDQAIKQHQAAIVIDFTTPHAVFQNAQTIINAGARPVIGTTGLTQEQIEVLKNRCAQKRLGGVIAPNFSQGALLMMRFAQEAARYFPNVEIIETHHTQKLDSPSGTAVKTAQMISAKRDSSKADPIKAAPARGENHSGIQVHSVRLPGFYSHQTVVFGGLGEVLTLCHQGIDRQCCIPGIIQACRKVMHLDHLVYGLENILFAEDAK